MALRSGQQLVASPSHATSQNLRGSGSLLRQRAGRLQCRRVGVLAQAQVLVAETGVASVQGTSRKRNEDRYSLDASHSGLFSPAAWPTLVLSSCPADR